MFDSIKANSGATALLAFFFVKPIAHLQSEISKKHIQKFRIVCAKTLSVNAATQILVCNKQADRDCLKVDRDPSFQPTLALFN